MPSAEDVSETVDVAIIDSVYRPSTETPDDFNINRKVDRLDLPDGPEQTYHGMIVSEIIYNNSENARFNFFRVMQPSSGHPVRQRDLQWGIYLAEEHDMDILNLSLGNDHTDDNNLGCIHGDPSVFG